MKLVSNNGIILNTGGIKSTERRRTSIESIRATKEATKLACTMHYTLTHQPAYPRPSPTTLYLRSPSLAACREYFCDFTPWRPPSFPSVAAGLSFLLITHRSSFYPGGETVFPLILSEKKLKDQKKSKKKKKKKRNKKGEEEEKKAHSKENFPKETNRELW